MAALLQTQHLGTIQGKSSDGVTQYLGIKYATLKDRLADAVLFEGHGDGVLDATKDGPTAVSLPIGCDLELTHVQKTLPKKDLPQSDLDCLNLNIAVPANVTSASRLPVFLFIHGGGLVIGSNSWPQFDYTRLVKLSKEKNLPIVAVSVNYRLGALGFLTSEELRNAGYKANNGLRDQRVAIEWVRKHIHEFGGDSDNITVAGMSAGGASVTYHLNSEKALFKRAIAMSGTYFLTQPLPYEAHEQNYQKAMAALGLSNTAPGERIKTLLEMPAEEIVSRLPPSILAVPAIDGDIVRSAPSHAETGRADSNEPQGKNWCHELMIGDAQMDASIIAFLYPQTKDGCAKKFSRALNTVFSSQPTVAEEILKSYGVTENASDGEAHLAVLNFINDVLFFTPVLTFAQGWKGPTYVYYFNEGNPWEGPWQGRTNHILDLAYFFQNFREFLSPAQQAVATATAEDFFKFCHGQAPWPAITPGTVTSGFTARCYGPSSDGNAVGTVDQAYGGKSQRRSHLYAAAAKVGLDELAKVFNVFMSL
ncbi:Alpha/Beta hydrolase protein [Aspergillus granulosus]|uniref:Carboxylic ester hydrolase n=1 Tax=Aspergillus granulosus TaxID=176169 RepID=A0ABR4H1S7_9EURO